MMLIKLIIIIFTTTTYINVQAIRLLCELLLALLLSCLIIMM